jgi:hypothetical protein
VEGFTMKRAFVGTVAFVLAFGFAPAAFAQDQGGGGQGGGGQGGGGQGQGGQGQGGQGGRRGRGGQQQQRQTLADQLKPIVNLTDDQVTKVKALEDEQNQAMQKLRAEQQGDRNAMRQKMQDSQTKLRADVRALLTTEQQPKFDDWTKQQDARRQQRGQRGQNGQNGQNGRGGRNNDPAARNQRRIDEAMNALVLSPEEKSAVLPLVKKVVEVRQETRDAGQKRTEELAAFIKDKGNSPEDKSSIAARLNEIRNAVKTDDAKLKAAQDALREVLTVDNEARLCTLGLLP